MRAEPLSLRQRVVPRCAQRLNSARILPWEQDDGPQPEPYGDVVVVRGDLTLVPEIDPDCTEDVRHLQVEDGGIGVDQPMDAVLLDELVPIIALDAVDRGCIKLFQHASLHRPAAVLSPLRAWAASCLRLEKIEILVVLPGGRLLGLPYTGLLEPSRKPARLVAFELEEIIEEYVAELAAKQRFALERVQGGG